MSLEVEKVALNVGDELPFGYFEPGQEGRLTWNCDYDAEGRITSVFKYDVGKNEERRLAFLPSLEKAIEAREELKKSGWLPLKPPAVEVRFADGTKKGLTRKQKRFLAKRFAKVANAAPWSGGGRGQEEKG